MPTLFGPFEGVVPSTEVDSARWLVDRLHGFAENVGSIVPEGFESYVRVMHRVAEGATDRCGGGLLAEDATALADLLSAWTSTPDSCWFCLWDGYGHLTGSWATLHWWGDRPGIRARLRRWAAMRRLQVHEARERRAIARWLEGCGRVQAPERTYLLFRGPVSAATAIGGAVDPRVSSGAPNRSPTGPLDGPNLWWPDDRAWVVASEIDLEWTYIGGPAGLIDVLLTDQRFPCERVLTTDRIVPEPTS